MVTDEPWEQARLLTRGPCLPWLRQTPCRRRLVGAGSPLHWSRAVGRRAGAEADPGMWAGSREDLEMGQRGVGRTRGSSQNTLYSRLRGTQLGTQATWTTSCPVGREGERGCLVCMLNRKMQVRFPAEGRDLEGDQRGLRGRDRKRRCS